MKVLLSFSRAAALWILSEKSGALTLSRVPTIFFPPGLRRPLNFHINYNNRPDFVVDFLTRVNPAWPGANAHHNNIERGPSITIIITTIILRGFQTRFDRNCCSPRAAFRSIILNLNFDGRRAYIGSVFFFYFVMFRSRV